MKSFVEQRRRNHLSKLLDQYNCDLRAIKRSLTEKGAYVRKRNKQPTWVVCGKVQGVLCWDGVTGKWTGDEAVMKAIAEVIR